MDTNREPIDLKLKLRRDYINAGCLNDSAIAKKSGLKYNQVKGFFEGKDSKAVTVSGLVKGLGSSISISEYLRGTDKDQLPKDAMAESRRAESPIVLMYEKETLDTGIFGSFLDILSKAQRLIRMSGYNCTSIDRYEEKIADRLRSAPELKLEVMLVDSTKDVSRMVALIDQTFGHNSNAHQTRSEKPIAALKRLQKEFGKRVEYRMIPFPPAVALLIIDPDESDGKLKVEVYCRYDPWPHFVIPRERTQWFRYFCDEWAHHWTGQSRLKKLLSDGNRK